MVVVVVVGVVSYSLFYNWVYTCAGILMFTIFKICILSQVWLCTTRDEEHAVVIENNEKKGKTISYFLNFYLQKI